MKNKAPYQGRGTTLFGKNYRRYAALGERIDRRVALILQDPYRNTELLGSRPGQINLRGCRSARIDRNFRVIFVICEECREVAECEYCFCEGLPDKTVVFLTIGPHDKAYQME